MIPVSGDRVILTGLALKVDECKLSLRPKISQTGYIVQVETQKVISLSRTFQGFLLVCLVQFITGKRRSQGLLFSFLNEIAVWEAV